MDNIRFEEKEHRYFDENGVELISVTTRLKAEGFYDFLNRIKNIEYYQELGTAYHKAIHLYLTNNLKSVSPQLEGYVDGAIKYLKSVEAEILEVENTIGYLPMLTAGKPDLIIRARGVKILPDWKRSMSKSYFLQLAGYKFLHNISRIDEPSVEDIEIVILDGAGGYKLVARDKYPINAENAFVSMTNWQNYKKSVGY